jgi:hypothetical protein
MIESKKNQAALGIVGGLVVAMAGSPMHLDGPLRVVWTSVGVCLYAWGAMSLAEAKGYSRWWGLLALVTIVGMLVLVFMPDRHRNGAPIEGWPANRGT